MMTAYGLITRTGCPACGGTAARTLFTAALDGPLLRGYLSAYYARDVAVAGAYCALECATCATLYQRDVGNGPLLSDLYDQWMPPSRPEEDAGYRYDVTNPAASRDGHEIMVASAYLGVPLGAMHTLDYGMGWAGWARVARALGCVSHGYDLADSRMAHAAAHGILPDNGRYHFINTEQVMEHIEDPVALVGELAGKLRPGGVLKISVPAQDGVRAELARLAAGGDRVNAAGLMPLHPLEHVNAFSREGLARLGAMHGLALVRPGLATRYAFLRHAGAMDWADLPRVAKEMVRPVWQWVSPRNTYVWLQKPAA
ncbi:methyltransferase domain-containing protein [Novosphingobium sp. FSY-8]|uniref:Methyltransferase domain-containing protein n=1 Tax=Novosphingobium ovatum TaxID=1908523 RepID=A0ABW9XCG0_9SPHN|nr:class I SAM-dependent methyltransferase [Novosphingobium ovatum]NBC36220.1 methyltransferase domain-containing protein [Novosphingobium ovatum]